MKRKKETKKRKCVKMKITITKRGEKMISGLTFQMNKEDIETLKNMIEDRESCNLIVEESLNSVWLYSQTTESELRLTFLKNIKLTVSRVYLCKKRQGTFTQIINFLMDIAKKYGFKKIVIESVLTKEMEQFCLKNEFSPDPVTTMYIDNVLIGNYVKNLNE